MDKESKKEFNSLGRMIKEGFDSVDKRFQQVDKRFEEARGDRENLRGYLNENSKRLARIETDIEEIRKTYVDPREFDDLMARVKYLEVMAGVKSGR